MMFAKKILGLSLALSISAHAVCSEQNQKTTPPTNTATTKTFMGKVVELATSNPGLATALGLCALIVATGLTADALYIVDAGVKSVRTTTGGGLFPIIKNFLFNWSPAKGSWFNNTTSWGVKNNNFLLVIIKIFSLFAVVTPILRGVCKIAGIEGTFFPENGNVEGNEKKNLHLLIKNEINESEQLEQPSNVKKQKLCVLFLSLLFQLILVPAICLGLITGGAFIDFVIGLKVMSHRHNNLGFIAVTKCISLINGLFVKNKGQAVKAS